MQAAAGESRQPRLTYFAGWGLAEQCRWVMAASNIEWEQVALSNHEQFMSLRESGQLLFGQLPLLEIDGLRMVQSQAMVRYAARRGGLCGTSPAEEAQVDMIAEAVRDARGGLTGYPFSDDKKSHAIRCSAQLHGKQLPHLEAAIQQGGGTAVRSGLTYADVLLAEMIEGYNGFLQEGWCDSYPGLKALHGTVLAHQGVAAYLASDRRYPFPAGDVGAKYVANVNTVLGR